MDDFEFMDYLLWFGLPAFIAGAGAIVYIKIYKPKAKEDPIYFRCPGCTRKIRYFPRQVGHRGACVPTVAKLWTFPVPSVRRSAT